MHEMKYLLLYCVLLFTGFHTYAQKPKSGIYTYKVAFAEWQGRSLGATCTVKIKGDSITIINNGSLSGKKGDIIDAGIIMKHKKSGRWIIAHHKNDIYAEDIGGCSNGPTIIDFKRKIFETC